MKPVIVQTLIKKMKDRISIPDPPSSDTVPEKRRDRTGQFLIIMAVIAIIFVLASQFG